jgi:hypothetical protein
MKNPVGRPMKYKTPEEMQAVIDAYFKSCYTPKLDKQGEVVKDDEGKIVMVQHRPFTVLGIADALDMSRKQLIEYAERGEFSNTVARAKRKCELYASERLYDREGINGAKFTLINNFENYSDKQDIDVKTGGEKINPAPDETLRRLAFMLRQGTETGKVEE